MALITKNRGQLIAAQAGMRLASNAASVALDQVQQQLKAVQEERDFYREGLGNAALEVIALREQLAEAQLRAAKAELELTRRDTRELFVAAKSPSKSVH